MKTKTYFTVRVDVWDSAANGILEHIAGIDDFEVAQATYWAAVARWPAARITLRQRQPHQNHATNAASQMATATPRTMTSNRDRLAASSKIASSKPRTAGHGR
jgi:hypothetical protein